jgi:hypothetical protein
MLEQEEESEMQKSLDRIVRSVAAIVVCAGASVAHAGASNAEPVCGWNLEPVPGNGVRLFGADADFLGGVWIAGRSSGLSFPFPSLNFVARWDGQQWVQSDVPQPSLGADRDQSLDGIAALGPNEAIAVGAWDSLGGNFSVPQSMRWDGSSWELLDVPAVVADSGNGSGGFDDVSRTGDAVWAVGRTIGVAPGASDVGTQVFFATQLVGDTWEGEILPIFEELEDHDNADYRPNAIAGVAGDDVWVGGWVLQVGTGPDGALLAHWDGSEWTWSNIWPLMNSSSSSIEDIAAIASDDVWAVGDDLNLDTGLGEAVLLHWDGSAWTRFDAPVETMNVELRTVVARASDDVFAAGVAFNTDFPGGGAPEAYVLHYDGVEWTRVENSELAVESQFFAGAIDGNDDLWLVGRANEFSLEGLAQRGDSCADACPADVTGDGSVDLTDLNLVLANFGQASGDGDATGDGEVDLADLNAVLGAFGLGCG